MHVLLLLLYDIAHALTVHRVSLTLSIYPSDWSLNCYNYLFLCACLYIYCIIKVYLIYFIYFLMFCHTFYIYTKIWRKEISIVFEDFWKDDIICNVRLNSFVKSYLWILKLHALVMLLNLYPKWNSIHYMYL